MTFFNSITSDTLADLVGFKANLNQEQQTTISNLAYRRLQQNERDVAILKVLNKLSENHLIRSGSNDNQRWEKGWGEILENVKQNGTNLDSLRPQYFNYNIVRFAGDFAEVEHPEFEYKLYEVVRKLLFQQYLSDCDAIVDFGCGTGAGLVLLAELFPQKTLIGCDWAKSSQQIINLIAQEKNYNLQAAWFNMLTTEGAEGVPNLPNSAFVTMHSMEQLGENYKPFLDFMLARKPKLCVHIEPIVELYEENNFFDYLAIQYHLKRNYLKGFLPALQQLEKTNQIKILEKKRLNFGSFFHEGYSLIVWKAL